MGVRWLVLLWQHVVCSLFSTHVCVPLWVLIPKLKESSANTSVLASVLVAVGELAQVPGRWPCIQTTSFPSSFPSSFFIIIDMLQVCLVC